MVRPTIIFEPHVPVALQTYNLVKEAENAFDKTFDNINKTSCKTRFAQSFIPPVIFLSNEIIRSLNHYEPRDTDNFFIEDAERECPRYRETVTILTITLYQYIAESHTVLLYYEAIREYADNNGLSYQEAYEYALASALFEALYHECFPGAFVFQKHKHPISDRCQLIELSLYEYYAYCYCVDMGYRTIQNHLLDTYYKYFHTTYPYAHALYYMLRNSRMRISHSDSVKKHFHVFSISSGATAMCIDNALDELYYS